MTLIFCRQLAISKHYTHLYRPFRRRRPRRPLAHRRPQTTYRYWHLQSQARRYSGIFGFFTHQDAETRAPALERGRVSGARRAAECDRVHQGRGRLLLPQDSLPGRHCARLAARIRRGSRQVWVVWLRGTALKNAPYRLERKIVYVLILYRPPRHSVPSIMHS